MPQITLSDKQLRGMLRQERRKASRQAAKQARHGGQIAAPLGGPLEIVAPLGVELGDAGEDFSPDHEGELQSVTREILDTVNPAGMTAAGYPYTICSGAEMAAKDPSKMSATFVVVTRQKNPNRHGNMVQIMPGPNGNGLQIEDWAANPVVLFDHGMGLSLPIGSAAKDGKLYWQAQKSKAVSTVFFSQSLPEAAAIYALIDEGILKAASIQFAPTKAMRLATKKEELQEGVESLNWQGWDFTESNLYEWSVVAIPADPGALKKSLEAGKIAGQRIGSGLKYALAQHLAPAQVMVPGVTLEKPAPIAPAETQSRSAVDTPVEVRTVLTQLFPNGVEIAQAFRQQFEPATKQPSVQEATAGIVSVIASEIRQTAAVMTAENSRLDARLQQLAGN